MSRKWNRFRKSVKFNSKSSSRGKKTWRSETKKCDSRRSNNNSCFKAQKNFWKGKRSCRCLTNSKIFFITLNTSFKEVTLTMRGPTVLSNSRLWATKWDSTHQTRALTLDTTVKPRTSSRQRLSSGEPTLTQVWRSPPKTAAATPGTNDWPSFRS
jgi:hypothetical protein